MGHIATYAQCVDVMRGQPVGKVGAGKSAGQFLVDLVLPGSAGHYLMQLPALASFAKIGDCCGANCCTTITGMPVAVAASIALRYCPV